MTDDETDVCRMTEDHESNADDKPSVIPEGKPVLRDANGRFLPGTARGPGRPHGAKSQFNKQVVDSLQQLWERDGMRMLEELALSRPEVIMGMVSRMIPQQLAAEAITGEEQAAVEAGKDITIRLVQQVQDNQQLTDTPRLVEGEILDDDEVITH